MNNNFKQDLYMDKVTDDMYLDLKSRVKEHLSPIISPIVMKDKALLMSLAPSHWGADSKYRANNNFQDFTCSCLYIPLEHVKLLRERDGEFAGFYMEDNSAYVIFNASGYEKVHNNKAKNSHILNYPIWTINSFKEELKLHDDVLWNKIIFIFEELNWEQVSFILNVSGIRVSGGSHNKRHLFSVMDHRLLKSLEIINQIYKDRTVYKNLTTEQLITASFYEVKYNKPTIFDERVKNFLKIQDFAKFIRTTSDDNIPRIRMSELYSFYTNLEIGVADNKLIIEPNTVTKEFFSGVINHVNSKVHISKSSSITADSVQKREYSTSSHKSPHK